jgi:hypothetical protein
MKVTPFAVSVADAALADLRRRLQLTRWPDEVGEGAWEYGMPRKVLWDVVEYWRDRFDWRAAERRLNGLPQFTIEIDGLSHWSSRRGPLLARAPLRTGHASWPRIRLKHEGSPIVMEPAPGDRTQKLV